MTIFDNSEKDKKRQRQNAERVVRKSIKKPSPTPGKRKKGG